MDTPRPTTAYSVFYFAVASISGAVNGTSQVKKGTKRGAGGSKKGAAAGKTNFQCDLAKSNRSTCRGCHETIIKVHLLFKYALYSCQLDL